jgi:hypothetical protein
MHTAIRGVMVPEVKSILLLAFYGKFKLALGQAFSFSASDRSFWLIKGMWLT